MTNLKGRLEAVYALEALLPWAERLATVRAVDEADRAAKMNGPRLQAGRQDGACLGWRTVLAL